MENTYHLLNGDALKERFPIGVLGKQIIFRECFVDGPVGADEASAFIKQRVAFLTKHYGASGETEYRRLFLSQMEELDKISTASPLYLWFEEDLFCQVNLWYVLHRLFSNKKTANLFLVLPPQSNPYSFGESSTKKLEECFKKALPLKNFEAWSALWIAYQKNNLEQMLFIAERLQKDYPFVFKAVQMHKERLSTENGLGRPLERLKAIKKQLNSTSFELIFQAFCKTESHYGFGDLTVKRLLKELE